MTDESLRATVRAAIRESRCYTELVNMLEAALAQVTPAPSPEAVGRTPEWRENAFAGRPVCATCGYGENNINHPR